MITRDEWNALTTDEQFEYVNTTETLLEARDAVLKEIPECEQHGFCLPHCQQWIIAHRDNNAITIDEDESKTPERLVLSDAEDMITVSRSYVPQERALTVHIKLAPEDFSQVTKFVVDRIDADMHSVYLRAKDEA